MATPAHIVKQAQRQTRAGEQVQLNELEKKLLNEYQKGFPLSPTPFADIAAKIGTSEALVLQILQRLQDIGVISRIGPVFKPKKVGTSTLAAMLNILTRNPITAINASITNKPVSAGKRLRITARRLRRLIAKTRTTIPNARTIKRRKSCARL